MLAALPQREGVAEPLLEWPVQPLAAWRDLFPGAPTATAGRVAVPESAGWGLVPDSQALERLTVPG